MIKVLAFDFGEVIFTNDWHYNSPGKNKAFCSHFKVTEEQLEDGWKAAWPQYEIGKITEDEFWDIFLRKAGAADIDISEAKRLWRKYFDVKPGMFELLDTLKKKYKMVIISTTGNEWLAYKREKYHLDTYFADYFTSCGMGMKKTNPALFQNILKKLDILPEELLFVDDNHHVAATAHSVGIETVLFADAQQLKKELKLRNIL